jgi:hypothetical protein
MDDLDSAVFLVLGMLVGMYVAFVVEHQNPKDVMQYTALSMACVFLLYAAGIAVRPRLLAFIGIRNREGALNALFLFVGFSLLSAAAYYLRRAALSRRKNA